MAKVLVVDDFPEIRALFKSLLDAKHHISRGAENGLAGLQALVEFKPNIIFLDKRMPVMDGVEFARTLRADKKYSEYSEIPIIGIGCFQKGEASLDVYMPKPFSIDVLYYLIDKYTKKSG